MAILVKHKTSGLQYALIGSGYSYFKETLPNHSGGILQPKVESGVSQMLAVCDVEGRVSWLPSVEVCILSIDGIAVVEVLKENNG